MYNVVLSFEEAIDKILHGILILKYKYSHRAWELQDAYPPLFPMDNSVLE